MNFWEAALLGFIQGATEFLPVSSSGHLVIGQSLLDIRLSGVHFEVAVHAATLLSVLVVYRERVGKLITGAARRERDAWRYIGMLVLGTIPAAVIGVGLSDWIEQIFDAPAVTGYALLVTAAVLWSSRRPLAGELDGAPTPRGALLIGLAQAAALVPGISRSGSTVVAGLWLGIDAREAAAFSFLLAVPAIAGAAVLQIPDLMAAGTPGLSMGALLVGSAVAAVTGVLAIRTFVAFLARKSFHAFGVYCAVVGAAFLGWLYLA